MLIQIQRLIKLGLLRQQFFQARFVLERSAQLREVVGKRLLLPLDILFLTRQKKSWVISGSGNFASE